MSRWVGVHGINQDNLGRETIRQDWVTWLADGVEWATGRRVKADLNLDLAFYGHLFRAADFPDYAPKPRVKGPHDLDDVAWLDELDEAERSALEGAVSEIVSPNDLAIAVEDASKQKSVIPLWGPTWAVSLAGAVERRFPRGSGIYFLWTLTQVRKYLLEEQLKADVDDIAAAVATGATVLIGHSLGSVVAYEFLRQHPGHSVQLLLTLGSPLGLRMIRDRLPVVEPGVCTWVNIRDPHDPVTAAGSLSSWYPVTREPRANGGFDPHSAERYLNFKATGEALKDFLPEAIQ
jgi:hypothetical protein